MRNSRWLALAVVCAALSGAAWCLAQAQAQAQATVAAMPGRSIAGESTTLGGRHVVIWRPAGSGPAPIIIFSHGFLGCPTQSTFLTQALADAGYLVVAPEHADSLCSQRLNRPEVPFLLPQDWSDATYRDRQGDIVAVIEALHHDPAFAGRIDWSRLGLMGHSLGGYTVLGLAGGWPSWRLPGVKAVVALSPFCLPFLSAAGELSGVSAPVEYQGGTLDFGITPSVAQHNGCYDATPAPAEFVDFRRAGHLSWTDMVAADHADMIFYARAFFDAWLRGRPQDELRVARTDVAELRVK